MTMRCINSHFTYLLTYLPITTVCERWYSRIIALFVSVGRELSATEVTLKLTYIGRLDRTRDLEVSSNCERVNAGWKCQLRYTVSICQYFLMVSGVR